MVILKTISGPSTKLQLCELQVSRHLHMLYQEYMTPSSSIISESIRMECSQGSIKSNRLINYVVMQTSIKLETNINALVLLNERVNCRSYKK